MHKIHVTDGLVLQKRGVGEGSVSVTLLTRELGVLYARAQSARAEKSKLRYGLEPLTSARFSLVRGKQLWRLTGAEEISRAFASTSTKKRMALGRVSKLLLRLITGEEPVPALYQTVAEGFDAVCTCPLQALEATEIVLVLRVLSQLGYLPRSEALAPFVDGAFTLEVSAEALKRRALLVRAINESLGATGL